MENPQVQFYTNHDLDLWTAKEFKIGTADDIQEFYKSHIDDLENFNKNSKEKWDKVSPLFFSVISGLFHQNPWPIGEYIGYSSMFNCNPRFLNNKTFQIYYMHKAGSNYVTAHELLHFIFYDYAIKKHADLFGGKDTESGIFWDVAEIFNSVVLHSPMFSKIHDAVEQITYPEHKGFVQILNSEYSQTSDIDEF